MPNAKGAIKEKSLTKGELRKLRALRKSIGDALANEAFAKWHTQQGRGAEPDDPNIAAIENALNPLIKKIRIARGSAYAVRRGRGRFIVEPVDLEG